MDLRILTLKVYDFIIIFKKEADYYKINLNKYIIILLSKSVEIEIIYLLN